MEQYKINSRGSWEALVLVAEIMMSEDCRVVSMTALASYPNAWVQIV